MKKKVALTLIAALTMSVFVGCAAPEDEGTTPGDDTNIQEEIEDTDEDIAEEVEDATDIDQDTDVTYTDGTYEGVGEGFGGDIRVSVEVVDGQIANIEILEQSETTDLGDVAVETVAEQIVDQHSTQVDIVSGATWSSEGTMEAVQNALEEAQ